MDLHWIKGFERVRNRHGPPWSVGVRKVGVQVRMEGSIRHHLAVMALNPRRAILFLVAALVIAHSIPFNFAMFDPPDPETAILMESAPICLLRPYTMKVKQEDDQGLSCTDTVTVSSCWGRCDSNEVRSSKRKAPGRLNSWFSLIFRNVSIRLATGAFLSSDRTIQCASTKTSSRESSSWDTATRASRPAPKFTWPWKRKAVVVRCVEPTMPSAREDPSNVAFPHADP